MCVCVCVRVLRQRSISSSKKKKRKSRKFSLRENPHDYASLVFARCDWQIFTATNRLHFEHTLKHLSLTLTQIWRNLGATRTVSPPTEVKDLSSCCACRGESTFTRMKRQRRERAQRRLEVSRLVGSRRRFSIWTIARRCATLSTGRARTSWTVIYESRNSTW